MFTAFDNLGKNEVSSFSSPTKITTVSLLPAKNECGDLNYISLLGIKKEDEAFAQMYGYNDETIHPMDVNCDEGGGVFSVGKDPIKRFYIGSLTVVGLFILYRLIKLNQ